MAVITSAETTGGTPVIGRQELAKRIAKNIAGLSQKEASVALEAFLTPFRRHLKTGDAQNGRTRQRCTRTLSQLAQ